jgi:hypothetical protein
LTEKLIVAQFASYYEVRNVSPVAKDYAVTWVMPKPFGGNYPGLCGLTSVKIDRVEQLRKVFDEQDGANPTVVYEKLVRIPPGKTINVFLESYSVRQNDDKEQWQTLIPCAGMTIFVTDENGTKDIFLQLDAPLLEGEEKFAIKDPNTNKATLRIPQYLLPYQGVTITWTPSRVKSDGAAAAT